MSVKVMTFVWGGFPTSGSELLPILSRAAPRTHIRAALMTPIKKAAGGFETTTATASHYATYFIAAGARHASAKAHFRAKPCHGRNIKPGFFTIDVLGEQMVLHHAQYAATGCLDVRGSADSYQIQMERAIAQHNPTAVAAMEAERGLS